MHERIEDGTGHAGAARTTPVLAIAATTTTAWGLLLVAYFLLADPAPVCPPSGCGFTAADALRAAPFALGAAGLAWWTARLCRRHVAESGGRAARPKAVAAVLLGTLAFVGVVLVGSL